MDTMYEWIAGKHCESSSSSCHDGTSVGISMMVIDRCSVESQMALIDELSFEYDLCLVVIVAFLVCLVRLPSKSMLFAVIGSAERLPPRIVIRYSDARLWLSFAENVHVYFVPPVGDWRAPCRM